MSVDIEPSELGFQRPFTVEVSRVLKIKNTHTSPIAFKVKTTAPKQYCVRPNSGRIEPGREVEVSVLLQAMKQDPPIDAKCRDKFLVQSVSVAPDKDFGTVQEIWDSVEKSAIQERKIRVTFLPAEGGKPDPAITTPVRRSLANGTEATPDAPSTTYISPKHNDDIVRSTANAPYDYEERRRPSPDAGQEQQTVLEKSTAAVSAAASTVVSAKDTAVDIIKEKLPQPEAVTESLKDVSGLRQRKAGTATVAPVSSGAQGELQQAVRQGTEGVPVHIVAALCLVSFLLAYFFF